VSLVALLGRSHDIEKPKQGISYPLQMANLFLVNYTLYIRPRSKVLTMNILLSFEPINSIAFNFGNFALKTFHFVFGTKTKLGSSFYSTKQKNLNNNIHI